MQLQKKMIIIETTIIFCCRLGSLFIRIEKLFLKQDFKSNIDIDATTNEDDNYRNNYYIFLWFRLPAYSDRKIVVKTRF